MVLATWNLENLFLPGEGDGPRDQPAYERKLDALAGTIGELDPDVLAVQEVGDPRALDDLVERLGGSWNVALAGVREGERSIRVGFVSKPALDSVEEVLAFPDGLEPIQVEDGGVPQREMGRPALKARIRIENRTVDLVTCHLKSKLLTYPDGRFQPRDEDERARYAGYALFRRTAEAVTLRAYVNRLLEGAGDDRKVIRRGFVTALGGVLRDRARFARPGVDLFNALHERVADEDVVDQLAAAAEHAAEATVLWDQRSEVPQPRAIALVGPFEAGGADLGAPRTQQDLRSCRRRLVVEVAQHDHRALAAVAVEQPVAKARSVTASVARRYRHIRRSGRARPRRAG